VGRLIRSSGAVAIAGWEGEGGGEEREERGETRKEDGGPRPFEVSTNGSVWSRAKAQATVKAACNDVLITLDTGALPRATCLQYGFDALVQCPHFDEKLPLGSFSVAIAAGVGIVGGGRSTISDL
jgi:hypothetical protein